jgi:hypothetical protein
VLIINDNNTGSLSVGGETDVLTWTYDIETCTLTLIKESSPDSPMTLTYVESNDILISAGPTFRRAETFPEKIERGTVTTSENPLLPILFQTIIENGWEYLFKEDGTCSDTDFWWIYSDESDRLAIYISDEYQYKYYFVIFAGGTVAYDEAYYYEGSLNWMPGYKIIKPIDKRA